MKSGFGRILVAAPRIVRNAWRGHDVRGVVLLYHGIGARRLDPYGLTVRPEQFDAQMRILARETCVLTLREFAEAALLKRLPPRSVAVTFDDGYADNLHVAAPILARHGVPATLFVATDFLDAPGPLWWDELADILLATTDLPARLRLTSEAAVAAGLGEQTLRDNDAEGARRCEGWTAYEHANGDRSRLFGRLMRLFGDLEPSQRSAILVELRAWAASPTSPRERAMLTNVELVRLAAQPGFDLGAHSVTHRRLSALPVAEQVAEIEGGKRDLEARLGCRVRSFAYPYGGVDCYTEATVDAVRDAGFDHAFVADERSVTDGMDPFRFSRRVVRGAWASSPARFERWLAKVVE